MAVAKTKDLRALPADELSKRLETYRREMLELGDNPKKGMNLKKAIARVLTLMNETKGAKAAGTQHAATSAGNRMETGNRKPTSGTGIRKR